MEIQRCTEMKIAIAILNWNGKSWLEKFLPNVLENSQSAEVYVIDNASTDDSVVYISTCFPSVKIVINQQNQGFAGGYNEGLKQINADISCLLNSDVEVTPGWLDPVATLFEKNPDIAAIQPKVLDYNRKNFFEFARGAGGGLIDNLGYLICRGDEETGKLLAQIPEVLEVHDIAGDDGYIIKVVKQAAIVGFLLLFLDMGALIWAEQHVSSGIAAIMAAAAALWFIILDKKQWKNNFSSKNIVLGLIAGFIGVIMLFAEQINIAGDTSQQLLNLFCMLLLILGAIAWTAGSLYSKYKYANSKNTKQENSEDLHVMVITAWQMITAGTMFTLVAIFNGEYSSFHPQEVSVSGWISVGYLIFFGSIMAFGAYIWLIQSRPTMEDTYAVLCNHVVAVALSYFFTDDIN
ncbi:hypothetical protein FQR65_LT14991 [Abscondita terminalis]|nr:hypothetical protein FQR65_LT14991 [Abscondita terminalis]